MRFSLTPDALFDARQIRQNASLRARIQNVGQETVTGRVTDPVQATNGRVGEAFLLEKARTDIVRQQGAADLVQARLSTASLSIESIREALTGFSTRGLITLEMGQERDINLLMSEAGDALERVTRALAGRQGTRHIFSGTQSSNAPLAPSEDILTAVTAEVTGAADATAAIQAIDDYFNAAGGGFETDIYQGSVAEGPRMHVSNNKSFDPVPKADDPRFRNIIQGFALVATSGSAATEADRNALIEEGLRLLDTGFEDAVTLETRLGADQQKLEQINTQLQSENALLNSTIDNLLGRDVFDAAAELQALQGQLEASYTVTGRLGALSLADFLR